MMNLKTLLVEKSIDCPNCGETLSNGDIMYEDLYRGDVICGHCKEDYEDAVIAEEGEDGRLLK